MFVVHMARQYLTRSAFHALRPARRPNSYLTCTLQRYALGSGINGATAFGDPYDPDALAATGIARMCYQFKRLMTTLLDAKHRIALKLLVRFCTQMRQE